MNKLRTIIAMFVLLLGSTAAFGIETEISIVEELCADSSTPSDYDDWNDDDSIGGGLNGEYTWSYVLNVGTNAKVMGSGSGWAVAYAEASVSGIASDSIAIASCSSGTPDPNDDSASDSGTKWLYLSDTLDLDIVVALQVDWFSGDALVKANGAAYAHGSIE